MANNYIHRLFKLARANKKENKKDTTDVHFILWNVFALSILSY